MSTIQSEIYDALIDAGASEPKARAAAEAVAKHPKSDEVATKLDISELKVELYRAIWLQGAAIIGLNLTAIGIATAFLASLIQ